MHPIDGPRLARKLRTLLFGFLFHRKKNRLLGCLADYDERFLWKPKNHIIELGFRNIDGDLQKTRLTRVYASMSMHPGSRHALLCNLAWTMSRAQGVPVEASLTTAARIC